MSSSETDRRGLRPWPELPFVRNAFVGCLAIAASFAGALDPVDRMLQNERFSLLHRPPSGHVAVVEIDSASLQQVGLWPWPRALHARMLDRLNEMGAAQIVFDIDFSSESDPRNDAEFAAALGRAQGKVALAAFEQSGGAGGGRIVDYPIKAFAAASQPVDIDVPTDSDGQVRNYRPYMPIEGRPAPTAATLIAGDRWPRDEAFGLDFGIDINEIDRMSAADIIAGAVDPERVRGKAIIIGSTAEELRDSFLAPRFGLVPGAYIHALAAESLLQWRGLRDLPAGAFVGLIGLLVILASAWGRRSAVAISLATSLVSSLVVEAAALWLQHDFAIRAATATAQFSLLGFGAAALIADVRLRRRMHAQASREREVVRAMLGRVVADNFDGVVVVGPHGTIIAASDAARALVGPSLEGRAAVDALPHELADPLALAMRNGAERVSHSAIPGETELADSSGRRRIVEFVITVSAVQESRERSVACLTFRDITERRAHEARLFYLARHDELTGAWTRGRLVEGLRDKALSDKPDERETTLFSLNLRRFAMVNDVFGYEVGDALLKAVTLRLVANGFSMAARLGGDNFAFVQFGAATPAELEARGRAVVALICEPYRIGERRIVVGASLGATTTAISGYDPDTILMNASTAQASAKRETGDAFRLFSPDMEGARREKQRIDAALRLAIADGSLVMHYQPKMDLATGTIAGAEALMRWRTSDGKSVSPATFIPVAEESGLIVELGRWALERACAECAAWPRMARVAVNVSPVQFALADVVADVERALSRSGLPPRQLEIEITESAFVDRESSVAATLERLRALGVSIAIDDFGTGYSSLHYLGRLPVDTIKIDQSFVRELNSDPKTEATVRAICTLARAHGKILVAEGVETEAQARWLEAIGCEFAQGYLFGRPREGAFMRMEFSRLFPEETQADGGVAAA